MTKLKRSITFRQLLFYGLGTMVGAGFYALLGKIAGEAGSATPIAFLIAGLLALINAFTYGELSSRFPSSAGEVRYIFEGFHRKWLSNLVGWLVVLTGVVSSATLVVATLTFASDLLTFPVALGTVLLVLALGGISAWGITESVWTVLVITAIEIGTLILILILTGPEVIIENKIPELSTSFSWDGIEWVGILSGAFLGFYAFIGFEDMLKEFYALQGKSERIKNFPFPRQYATANYFFVMIFVILLPFTMLSVFDSLPEPWMIWFSVPFSILASWVFWMMESIGEYSENPFEGLYNDVPITSMARGIEIDIRQMLEETDLPEPLKPVGDFKILY